MKVKSEEAFAHQFSKRTLVAAEACSELGLASEHVRSTPWLARCLLAVRRWFGSDDLRSNG